ncbi:hypothetical protein UPYG_G00264000 [Umbra pygmaea]|uniref:Spermatogenesis-associated protein 2 PUB-like domain-containing protein n=1 Tax=Umbra pygmaea TaxID=75934 RepID=A0ABD0WEB5_UMBPY
MDGILLEVQVTIIDSSSSVKLLYTSYQSFAEMSVPGKEFRNLVALYQLSLEQQILQGDSNLVCKDEGLCKEVEELLRDGCSQDTHSLLGLDPLRVMEESLKSAPVPPVKGRVGLKGLARAFELLELAAVNLFLCPWRKEYKVVKTFSGMFTHYVKPVLSMQQVAHLFGLLGYQASEARHQEELSLRSPALPMDTLISLACGFYIARCECCLLLNAIGPQAGWVEWELNLVQERRKGHSLQKALDNSMRRLETIPEKENTLELSAMEGEMDLYTDDLRCLPVNFNTSPSSTRDSNGLTAQRDNVCVSTLHCQLTRTTSLATTRNTPIQKQRDFTTEDLASSHEGDSCGQSGHVSPVSLGGSCVTSYSSIGVCVKHGRNCNRSGVSSCLPEKCNAARPDLMEDSDNSRASSWPRVCGDRGAFPPHSNTEPADDFQAGNPPLSIPFHDCCLTAKPEPGVMCFTCRVFHTSACKEATTCLRNHDVNKLGLCTSPGCSKGSFVLCRYCSAEFCKDCWYREPLNCPCGQLFDQSSSV